MERGGAIYILTNKNKTTLYIGVTSDLVKRIDQHKTHFYPQSFTAKYQLEHLLYDELFFSIEEAIAREKELKNWSRKRKENLIAQFNPDWTDLWEEIKDW
jgi:putative endonuclease